MIDLQVFELAHRQIIIDLTIRTLERDRKHIDNLKMKSSFDLWMDRSIKEMKEILKDIKSQLSRKGIKFQQEKVDGEFTVYTFLDKGKVFERRYNNVALKNWCCEEVKRLLGLEYRTIQDGKNPPPSR